MEEIKVEGQPVPEETKVEENRATTPESTTHLPNVTLKFNKEILEVPYDEAVTLAQKGLKFDKISPELERIKNLAGKKGMSIGDFLSEIENSETAARREQLLESSGGNEELTEHILKLEEQSKIKNDSLESLKREFPQIKSSEDLPDEVLEQLDLVGGNMLSAYLLYLHRQNLLSEESRLRQAQNRATALGSQQKNAPENTSSNEEFIKGIWS